MFTRFSLPKETLLSIKSLSKETNIFIIGNFSFLQAIKNPPIGGLDYLN